MCKMFPPVYNGAKIIKNTSRFSRVMVTNVLPPFYGSQCTYTCMFFLLHSCCPVLQLVGLWLPYVVSYLIVIINWLLVILCSCCCSYAKITTFWDTFFDVGVVGKLDFVTWITTILILDLFYHVSQHDHKIFPVSQTFTRVWRHAKQLLVHRLATWLLHFVPTSYSGNVTKG